MNRVRFPFVRTAVAVLSAVAALLPSTAAAQLVLRTTLEGNYDYVVTAATLRNQSNSGNPCSVSTSRSATLSGIPAGATVQQAFLMWAGSGSLDASVTFSNGSSSSSAGALRTATEPFTNGGNNYTFFSGVRDVTSLVTGNGTYTLSNLGVNVNNPYCSTEAVMGGWGLFVVYSQPGLPLRRISLYDGLEAIREGDRSVTLEGFTAAANPSVKLSVLVFEGDPDQVGTTARPERVRWDGSNLTDNNAFNSTINSLGITNSHGVDLDTYSTTLSSGATEATLTVLSGPDLVLWQAAMTMVDIATPRAVSTTPDGLSTPVLRLPGTGYSQQFTVTNTGTLNDTYNLLLTATGSPLVGMPDSIRGTGVTSHPSRPDSARVSIPAGQSRVITIWYSVFTGPPADNTAILTARSAAVSSVQDPGHAELRRVIPQLALTKAVTPQNVLSPGTELTYTLQFQNLGEFAARNVAVTDSVPPQVVFKLGSVTQTLPAGITATVAYSNNAGATWTYVPVSGGCGAPTGHDACVRRIRWSFTGDLAAGASASTGTLRFLARIQ